MAAQIPYIQDPALYDCIKRLIKDNTKLKTEIRFLRRELVKAAQNIERHEGINNFKVRVNKYQEPEILECLDNG
jgi:hypothetical protein